MHSFDLDPAEERQDLATHYDNTAYATVVVALNDPTEYEGGLFVQTGANVNTRKSVPFSSPGDAVLHRFDLMHGVNVRSGKKKRFSLVIG
jgi:predicted 2-oxoglutarate/Fe(II)-dependent dioxygenase YbiX